MASPPYGYRFGPRQLINMQLDGATAAVVAGDFMVMGTAGYAQVAAAGELPIGIAAGDQVSPTADGDLSVLIDISPDSVYEYPPDAGTVTQGLVMTTMDIGGAQSINIDASLDDIITVVKVDLLANTLFVKLTPSPLGVA
jgi:hypothetical protein